MRKLSILDVNLDFFFFPAGFWPDVQMLYAHVLHNKSLPNEQGKIRKNHVTSSVKRLLSDPWNCNKLTENTSIKLLGNFCLRIQEDIFMSGSETKNVPTAL